MSKLFGFRIPGKPENSWTKISTFEVGEIDCHRYVKPLAYSRSGDKVLVSPVGDGFYRYDFERHRVESIVEVDYQVRRCDVLSACVDTLVSPDAYTGN